ncbi:Nucleotidyltransferase family protein [Streptomyces misionensis JCM 4497]
MLMAGGQGSRLRPLTEHLPKPLLPVGGRPIMEHVLRLLRRHGIEETVVTVHYLAELIEREYGDGTRLGMSLAYVHEDRPLGTAGSVKAAEGLLGGEPFLVISGDALTDVDLTELVRRHRERRALVTVCLTEVADPSQFGVATLAPDGHIERFLEKPGPGEAFSRTASTGIYVMQPEVLRYVSGTGPADWARDVFPRLLAEGLPVYGHVAEGYWEDVGTHAAYARAQQDVARGLVDVDDAEPVAA